MVTGRTALATSQTALVALDAPSGRVLWTVGRARGALHPPALDPGAGRSGAVVFTEGTGASDSGLVAIDMSTRRQLWRLGLRAADGGAPTIDRGTVFFGGGDGFIYAIDLMSGRVRWKTAVTGQVDVSPAVAGGRVFAVAEESNSGRATLYAVDAESGKTAWTYSPPVFALGVTSPTVAGGAVYQGFGDLSVRALDWGTGSLRWSERVRNSFSRLSSPAFSGGDLYISDRAGGLYRLDGHTGDRVWDYQFASRATRGAPLVTSGTAYLGMDDGTVAGVDVSSGRLSWRSSVSFGPLGPVSPAGDLLLAPSSGRLGRMVAFRSDPGGALLDIPSPTRLQLARALLNFSAAMVVILLLLLSLFRLLSGAGAGQGRRRAEAGGGRGT